MKNKEKLLDVLKMLAEKESDIECIFGGDSYLSKEITVLSEIIMQEYDKEIENEIVFEQLMNFADGDITKKKLLEKYLS